ncbi:TetR/AcrR family transcriptional regulator [Mycobacterium sp. pUA109]|uniref:TetR/AcrR family transcriptional regulator n=1 Tax=Mycobacterium sp. pUA109 TaxID=3238982 RepID=UPI00351B5B4E
MVAKIVAATSDLLRAEGPEAVTTNRVAEITGISKGSIYQYFRTKEDIIVAAIRDTAERQTPTVRAMLTEIALEPPREMIDAAIDILIAFSTDNAATIRYLAKYPEFSREVEPDSDMPMLMQTMVTMHVRQYRDQYRPDLEPENIAWLFINSAIATTLLYFESSRRIDLQQFRMGLKHMAYGLLADGATADHR